MTKEQQFWVQKAQDSLRAAQILETEGQEAVDNWDLCLATVQETE